MAINLVLDALFPKHCLGCRKTGSYLCIDCQVGLWEQDQVCPRCGRQSAHGQTHLHCRKFTHLDGLICLWTHQGIARKLMHKVNQRGLFDYLTEILTRSTEILDRPEYSRFMTFVKNNRPLVISSNSQLSQFWTKELNLKNSSKQYAVLATDNWTSGKKESNEAHHLKQSGVKQVWVLALTR